MIEKILKARENKQKNLSKFMKNDLVYLILKVNFPGEDKRTTIAHFLINLFRKRIFDTFSVKNNRFFSDYDGFYEIFEINSKNANEIKVASIELEESPLGRFVDIDVYYNSLKSISREELGFENRKCYICNEMAHVCVRNRTHSLKELKEKIEDEVIDYIFEETKNIIKESLELECELNPKFGLVTSNNTGSHSDMNYDLMMRSKEVIAPYIAMMTISGFCNEIDDIFYNIREIGKKAEVSMYKVTGGINTYKGLIFGMGFAAAAIGYLLNKDQVNYHMLKDTIMYLGRNLEDDFSSPLDTFGFLAYKNYGFLGARGEVIRGLPNAFKAIKVLDEYECYDNEALTMALIEIIRGLEDTVLLKRSGSLEKYNYYKNLVGSIDNYDITKIEEITEECISENISFGGSADILAISIFIKKMLERLVFYERQ